jgi:hypothetical protein
MVLEDDEAIYKSVLQALILEPLTKVFKKQWLEAKNANFNSKKEEELSIPNIV